MDWVDYFEREMVNSMPVSMNRFNPTDHSKPNRRRGSLQESLGAGTGDISLLFPPQLNSYLIVIN